MMASDYTKITPSTSGSSGWPFGDNWNSSAGDPWCPTRWPMVPRIRGTLGQLTHCHFSDIGAEPKRDTPKLSTGHLKLIVHWTSWESINLKLPKLCPLETNYQKVTHGAPSSPTHMRNFIYFWGCSYNPNFKITTLMIPIATPTSYINIWMSTLTPKKNTAGPYKSNSILYTRATYFTTANYIFLPPAIQMLKPVICIY